MKPEEIARQAAVASELTCYLQASSEEKKLSEKPVLNTEPWEL